jgi:hypothetical protein
MNGGDLQGLLIVIMLSGLFVTGMFVINGDFANQYGFSNESNPQLQKIQTASINYYGNITYAQEKALETTGNPVIDAIAGIFNGGAFAIHSFLNLGGTLQTMLSSALTVFGIPEATVGIFFYGIIGIIVLFAVLIALGIIKVY